MSSNSITEALWEKGIQPEVISFLDGMDWTLMFMLMTIFYGLTHTRQFSWLDSLLNKLKIHSYIYWIVAILVGLVFCLFKWEEGILTTEYVSALLRSIVFVVIFSNVFVDIPVFLIKKLGSIIDKDKAPVKTKTRKKKN